MPSPEDLAQASSLRRILAEYKKYEFLFQEGPRIEALLKHQLQDYNIPIKLGKSPSFRLIYQLLEKKLAILKEYININLKKGFIRLSISSAASLLLFVLKKNRKLRLYIDYRQLNSITIKDRYLLLLINKLYNRLREALQYIILDMREAYNLVRIKEGEEQKIVF